MRTARRNLAALGAATTIALGVAACGDAAEETDQGAATESAVAESVQATDAAEVDEEHNEQDIAFAQGMIPHHRQAVMMAELADGRSENPDVLALSEEISAAQEPEIETMTTFLQAWDAEVPAPMAGMEGMETMETMEGMEGMEGMMSPEDMAGLEATEGEMFDQMFLQMMIEHHQGAVEMAQMELGEGVNPQATELAAEIVESQESEIATMEELLTEY